MGPRDLAEGKVGIVRRDTGEETTVPVAEAAATVSRLLEDVQVSMLASAVRRRDERTVEASTIEEAVEAAKVGFARIPWALLADGGEEKLGAGVDHGPVPAAPGRQPPGLGGRARHRRDGGPQLLIRPLTEGWSGVSSGNVPVHFDRSSS